MDEDERAELIAVLHQSVAFGEGMLEWNERLLDALTSDANRPDAEEIEYMRAALRPWQEQMTVLRAAACQRGDRAAKAAAVSRSGAARGARVRNREVQ